MTTFKEYFDNNPEHNKFINSRMLRIGYSVYPNVVSSISSLKKKKLISFTIVTTH